jgi:hypothetical protein
VLVALVLVAAALSSMTALVANTARANRSIDDFVPLISTARTVLTALPDRDSMTAAHQSGAIGDHHWRFDASPFPTAERGSRTPSRWTPEVFTVTVRTNRGDKQFSTVRLLRKGEQP